jgi:hypothetical protein
MSRFLITHSLLSSWLYSLKENPFEDATSERGSYAEFLSTLRREPSVPSDAMQKGIDFEDLVTDIISGKGDTSHKWYEAAEKVARTLQCAKLQFRAKREIAIGDWTFLLYGRLDALKAGIIYDIKYSGSYEVGKYHDSTQHPCYFEIVPEATEFQYLVSNGSAVWTEKYHREDAQSIVPIITDFISWLETYGLTDTYREHWLTK